MSFFNFLFGMHLIQEGDRRKAEEQRAILEAQERQMREREYNLRHEEYSRHEDEQRLQKEWSSFCCEQEYFRDDNYQKPKELDWEVVIAKKIPPYIWGMMPQVGLKNYKISRQIAIEEIKQEQDEYEEEDILRRAREMGYDD